MSLSSKRNTKSIEKFFDNPLPKSESKSNDTQLDQDQETEDSQDDENNDSQDNDSQEDQSIIPGTASSIKQNKQYYYLNDNILSKTFGDFMNTDKQYNVQICIYKMNQECDIPFLQFLFNITSEKASFPSIDFHCPPTSITQQQQQQSSDDPSHEHIFFMNQCSQELLKVLPIHDIFSTEILQQIYKGFVETGNFLYVVFDLSEIDIELDNSNYSWSIIDEIMNLKEIMDKKVDPSIIDLFMTFPYMMNIVDEKGMQVLQPSVLYMCQRELTETLYKNCLKHENSETINILDEPIEHPFLGTNYIFSTKPISSIQLIKRYSVFTYDCRYILTDITTISQEDKDEFLESLENNGNVSIYFKEDGIQLWCIKSSEQFTEI
jgi:hypothetical protein